MARAAKANKATLVTTQNLLLYSEQFENVVWTSTFSNVTITANQAANPIDGAMTADKMDFTAAGAYAYQNITRTVQAGENYTFSVWLWSPSKASIGIRWAENGSGTSHVKNCVLSSTPTRFDISGVAVVGTSILLGFDNRVGVGGDNLTGFVYAWGAQLVCANWPGPYVQTVAAAVNTGPIRNKAAGRQTLVAGQNLLKYSEQFNQASGWTPSGGLTVTPNATTAPDGTATADELVCPLADGYIPSAAATMPNRNLGTQYVLSVWLWSAAKASIGLRAYTLPSVLNGGYRTCNLTSTPTRFELTVTLTSSLDSQIVLDIENRAVYGSDALAGNVYAWGAQIVNANRAGVYVKTEASAVNTGNIRNTP